MKCFDMRTSLRATAAICAALAAPLVMCEPASSRMSTEQWQAFAIADLNAVRDIIQSSHPGAIDKENPEFQRWAKAGYAQATKLIPRVTDYNSAMAAVRSYVAGFHDRHLTYSDNARKAGYSVGSNGIGIALSDGRYMVTATMPDWPVALPPVGAELLSCDGLTPQQIVEQRHAPYYSVQIATDVEALASRLHLRVFADDELKSCVYRVSDGRTLRYEIRYKDFLTEEYFGEVLPVLSKNAFHGQKRRDNSYTFQNGVLWISAGNFNLRPDTGQAANLDAMLLKIRGLSGVKQIVFDTRGNQGGDSRVGWRIFEAATGGLEYDKTNLAGLPRIYAQWRVSDVALATFKSHIERMSKLYGHDSTQARAGIEMYNRLREAKDAGNSWVRQDSGYRITPADIAARGGHLSRFNGGVALVTDHACASACLDFADLIRSVPGSIHLGETTSSDTVYIDGGRVKLPSGNLLFIPLKVWRNRLRGNNEPLVPQVPLSLDREDKVVIQQVLSTLDNLRKHGSRL